MAWSKRKRIIVGVLGLVIVVIVIGISLMMKKVDSDAVTGLLADKFPIQRVVMNGGRVVQLSGAVSVKYPAVAVGEPTLRTLREMGWEICTGPNATWDSVLQDPDQVLVHQRTMYFSKGMELLIINMRYESKGDAKELRVLKQPNNDQQLVTVLQSNEGLLLYPKTSILGVDCP